ncbi:MAG TPA: TRAP transporter small permease [Spirochaetota bacterium]|nr:TRAP transporter small permease [Spirochaetota bacterium]
MYRIEKILHSAAARINWISMAAVFAMMALTVADVILRFLRMSMPGAYDIVGLLGAVMISFSLAYTSVEKGHIAVEFIVQKLPDKARSVIDAITGLLSTLFFAMATWRLAVYALDFYRSGEVSMTIKMPVYPFVFGMSLGSALLTMVLALAFFRTSGEVLKR